MALTKASETITDWTAVAQNTVIESGIIDISGHYDTSLHIQAFLDTTTAHTGTRLIVQVSQKSSGDEDWEDFTEFVVLVGTAAPDLIEDAPLVATSTARALTGHALTVLGIWLAIEDGTLANSELIFQIAQTTNEINILDGTTNAHAVSTAIFNVAISRAISVGFGVGLRARLLVDNTYDPDGSTLNYKINAVKVTAI